MNVNEKGFDLYWENYRRAFEWQNNSSISHWKARARSLEVENSLLRDFIKRELQSGPSSNFARPSIDLKGTTFMNDEDLSKNLKEDCEQTHSESDMDEELLAFYEKTIRHKMERRKQQSLEQKQNDGDSPSDNEEIYTMGPISTSQKSEDMTLLYGDEASKIFSMELSMQISFDMNCNKSNAQLWPNIPLRLS